MNSYICIVGKKVCDRLFRERIHHVGIHVIATFGNAERDAHKIISFTLLQRVL